MPSSSEDGDTKPGSTGIIVGIFFGVTAPSILLFLCAICVCLKNKWKRRRYQRQRREGQQQQQNNGINAEQQNDAIDVQQQDDAIEAMLENAFPEGDTLPQGLTEHEISQLPQHTFNPLLITNSSYETDQTCMVCLCDYEKKDKLITLACRHSFHVDCGVSWLRSNSRCPLCSGPPLEPKEPPKAHIAIDL